MGCAISVDARLLVADRYSGSFTDGGYLGVYSRMTVTWWLTLGEVDGEPSIILLHLRNGAWEIEGIIRLDIGAGGRIERISDYQHCPWVLTAGSVVAARRQSDQVITILSDLAGIGAKRRCPIWVPYFTAAFHCRRPAACRTRNLSNQVLVSSLWASYAVSLPISLWNQGRKLRQ